MSNTRPRKTEAGYLREYVHIQKTRAAQNAAALRRLVHNSDLTAPQAAPFYKLAEDMEKEAGK